MIGRLRGTVAAMEADAVVLDVGGVGYLVHCASRTLSRLPRAGEPATLAIETQVREDSIRLYGFLSAEERDWFRLLQSVQGVGAKVALAILGLGSASELAGAIALGDKAMIARASGVGAKLAARITAELKDKAPVDGIDPLAATLAGADPVPGAPPAAADAIAALVNLGYGRPQAAAAIAAALRIIGDDAGVPDLIRRGLKELASA